MATCRDNPKRREKKTSEPAVFLICTVYTVHIIKRNANKKNWRGGVEMDILLYTTHPYKGTVSNDQEHWYYRIGIV